MDLKLPHLGEGADSGTVVNLFVKAGDRIAKDQPILELENEKAVATIPATASGVITKVHVKTGDKLSVGQSIITVTETRDGGDGAPAAKAPSAAKPKARAPHAEAEAEAEESEPAEAGEPAES